jgi:hypothetical protein
MNRATLALAGVLATVLVVAFVFAAILTSAHADVGFCRAVVCRAGVCHAPPCNHALLLLNWTILLSAAGLLAVLAVATKLTPGTAVRGAVVTAVCLFLGVLMYGPAYQVYPFEALPGHGFPDGWLMLFVALAAGALVNRWWIVLVALAPPLLAFPLGTDAEGQPEWSQALFGIPLVGVPLALGVLGTRISERLRERSAKPNPPFTAA